MIAGRRALRTLRNYSTNKEEGFMPRREKDRELARRRKRKKEVRKLRAKGVLPPTGTVVSPKEVEKKKVKKEAPEKAIPEAPKEPSKETPKETPEPKPEG